MAEGRNADEAQESLGLDVGETEAISLALERNIPPILIDERKGFNVAVKHRLEPIGLLAVMEFPAAYGRIDFEGHLLRLRSTTFRFSERLVSDIRGRLVKS